MAAAYCVSITSINRSSTRISRTKGCSGPSKSSEESHGSDVLAREGVLNGGQESTGSSDLKGRFHGVCDGIFWVKSMLLV